MARKGTPIDDSPIESWHSFLKKRSFYNNNITSLKECIILVEECIEFYNTIIKLEAVIEYLKNNGGYDYELYNRFYPRYGKTRFKYR